MAVTSGSEIEQLLGDEAESLLSYQAHGIEASQLQLPGPDFIDRVLVDTDRTPPVLRNLGLLFNTVRTDKVADFEKLIASVRAALAASSDPKIKEQAKGWRFFKAAEPGPNNTVLYVFVIDPTVPGEDYGLGRVLSQGSTDAAALQEIWKLYTSSVTGGGSLLNLSPIPEPASDATASPEAAAPAPETTKNPAPETKKP